MIRLSKASVQRGSKVLLKDADLQIFPGQKLALIGANGSGKSSLFSVLLGEAQLDQGDLIKSERVRISHMAQEIRMTNASALEYVLTGDRVLMMLKHALTEAEANEDAEDMARLHGELDNIDGYQAEHRARLLLLGLGFAEDDLQKPVAAFSGGWRIRLNLAQALMSPADLLLLDEPTNHLDIDTVYWLQRWLDRCKSAVIVISHDRDFIDSFAEQIVHLDQQQLQIYRGNYSQFERQRAEKLALQQSMFERQQKKRADMEDFVRRFRAKASKAKQAQSRLKALEKMAGIDAVKPPSAFEFTLPASDKVSNPLLKLNESTLGYGDKVILANVDLSLVPGMRVGLLGKNGAGKSTLIKSLTGTLPLLEGEREAGKHLAVGYFAQHQLDELVDELSPLAHLKRLDQQAREQELRNFIGGYGFSGDQAVTAIVNFSGGEKARLALALLAWQKPNLLLLDEPTNHLDIEMREAMMLALQEYEGAMILVSHDRYLMRHCVDEFWWVHDGRVSSWEDSLEAYEQALGSFDKSETGRHANASDDNVARSEDSSTETTAAPSRSEKKRQDAELRQRQSPIKKELKTLERKLDAAQNRAKEIEQAFEDAELYQEHNKPRLNALSKEKNELNQALEQLEERWLDLSEQLENIR